MPGFSAIAVDITLATSLEQYSKPWLVASYRGMYYPIPGISTTIKTMGVNITTIAYLRVLIIEIGSTVILMVVEAQGNDMNGDYNKPIEGSI